VAHWIGTKGQVKLAKKTQNTPTYDVTYRRPQTQYETSSSISARRRAESVDQWFPTFLRSRTTWAPGSVNASHIFKNNHFDRILVYSEE